MFSPRIFAAVCTSLVLSNFAVATPVHLARQAPEPASACNTPPIRCCQSVLGEAALPDAITALLPPSLNATQIGDVGLNCTTIASPGLLGTETCDGSSVCCGGEVGDLLALNCALVTLPSPTLPLPPLSSILPLPPLTSILPPLTSILPLPPLSSILPGLPIISLLPGLPL